jgi:hypothetical protein
VGQVANLRADWQSAQTARVCNPRAGWHLPHNIYQLVIDPSGRK